jgi:transcriptional regulator with XRE-family HTH domain
MKVVNYNIKRMFDASGLTQKQFGALFGASPKVIWTYLSGKSVPGGTFLLRFCDYYSIDINFLSNTKIKANAKGEIINRPDYRRRAMEIRKAAELLIGEKEKADQTFGVQLRRLVSDLESLPARIK